MLSRLGRAKLNKTVTSTVTRGLVHDCLCRKDGSIAAAHFDQVMVSHAGRQALYVEISLAQLVRVRWGRKAVDGASHRV